MAAYQIITAKYAGRCAGCGKRIEAGERIAYAREWHGVAHTACADKVSAPSAAPIEIVKPTAELTEAEYHERESARARKLGLSLETSTVCPRCMGTGTYRQYGRCLGCRGNGRVSFGRAKYVLERIACHDWKS